MSCLSDYKPQEISNTAWALAKLGFKHDPLMNSLAEVALANMDDLNPHDLSGTVWAFATLSYTQQKELLVVSKILGSLFVFVVPAGTLKCFMYDNCTQVKLFLFLQNHRNDAF